MSFDTCNQAFLCFGLRFKSKSGSKEKTRIDFFIPLLLALHVIKSDSYTNIRHKEKGPSIPTIHDATLDPDFPKK
jgi:hypothetical protein